MITKITTERIYEYDTKGNIVRETERTTEEYGHDYCQEGSRIWTSCAPSWFLDGPSSTCCAALPAISCEDDCDMEFALLIDDEDDDEWDSSCGGTCFC